jgi:hypothetical protein
MMSKILPIGIALIVSILFLSLVLAPAGCGFNLLPYEIHEGISRGGAGESTFIKIFDTVFALALFWLIYRLLKIVLPRKSQ